LDALWHLGYNILMFWGKHTGRIRKSEVQYNINETHDKIPIFTTDIDDNTAEYPKEDSDLGNNIKFLNRGSKKMFWDVSSVWWTSGSI
jgi:hypothetical protein